MAEEKLLQKDSLVKSLADLVISGRQILENAIEERRNGSLQDFSSKKISLLLGFTDTGAHFLSSLSVKKRTEAEELWKKYFHDVDVQDHVEDLLQLETDWNEFVEGVDSELNLNGNLHGEVQLGGYMPGVLKLKDARSDESVSLGSYLGKGTKLLLVLLRHFA